MITTYNLLLQYIISKYQGATTADKNQYESRVENTHKFNLNDCLGILGYKIDPVQSFNEVEIDNLRKISKESGQLNETVEDFFDTAGGTAEEQESDKQSATPGTSTANLNTDPEVDKPIEFEEPSKILAEQPEKIIQVEQQVDITQDNLQPVSINTGVVTGNFTTESDQTIRKSQSETILIENTNPNTSIKMTSNVDFYKMCVQTFTEVYDGDPQTVHGCMHLYEK